MRWLVISNRCIDFTEGERFPQGLNGQGLSDRTPFPVFGGGHAEDLPERGGKFVGVFVADPMGDFRNGCIGLSQQLLRGLQAVFPQVSVERGAYR